MVVKELVNILGIKVDKNSLSKANKSMKKFADGAQKIGSRMTVGLTAPLTAFAGLSVNAFNKQEQALAQVEAGIEATGGAALKSVQDLESMAKSLQAETLFGDEEILGGATSQLLTFTNIAGEQFDRTQKAVLDVATRLATAKGGAVDLTSTSIMLGKALNDPVANLGALGRSGIQFSKSQKELIKNLWETGRQAEAQNMILGELEKQYGGSAKAAAEVGTGSLKQLMNIFGDFMEQLGEIIWELISPFIEHLKSLVTWFTSLSKGTKKVIVIIGALVAAIGPLLVVVGLATKAFIFFNTVMLANPIGLIIAGVVAAIAALTALYIWIEEIVDWLLNLWNTGGKIVKILMIIAAAVAWPITAIIAWIFIIKKIIKNFDILKVVALFVWGKITEGLGWVKDRLIEVKDSVLNFLSPILNFYKKIWNLMKKFAGFISGIFSPMINGIKNIFINTLNWLIEKYNYVAGLIGKEVDKIKKAEQDSAKIEKDAKKNAARNQVNNNTNVNMQNNFQFQGETPTTQRQAKKVVEKAAGSVFNLELKKLLISSGGI
jgi:phage-related minor tail protein